MTKPWINHDIHRTAPRPVPAKVQSRPRVPYPTMQRLHELFYFDDGKLIWIRPARTKPSKGWTNPKDGKRYLRVDGKQCQIEKLVLIYTGEE